MEIFVTRNTVWRTTAHAYLFDEIIVLDLIDMLLQSPVSTSTGQSDLTYCSLATAYSDTDQGPHWLR